MVISYEWKAVCKCALGLCGGPVFTVEFGKPNEINCSFEPKGLPLEFFEQHCWTKKPIINQESRNVLPLKNERFRNMLKL
jgi:hypothetical protein